MIGSTRASAEHFFSNHARAAAGVSPISCLPIRRCGDRFERRRRARPPTAALMFITLKPPAEREGLNTQLGDRPACAAISARSRASACSCSRHRTSAPAAGRAIPIINIRCRATGSRSVAEMGAAGSQADGDRRGDYRRVQRPRSRRIATDAVDRPQGGGQPRGPGPGHRQSRSTTRFRNGRSRSSTPSATST